MTRSRVALPLRDELSMDAALGCCASSPRSIARGRVGAAPFCGVGCAGGLNYIPQPGIYKLIHTTNLATSGRRVRQLNFTSSYLQVDIYYRQ